MAPDQRFRLPACRRPPRWRRLLAGRALALPAAVALAALPAAGQFPAELAGRVLDAETGAPVEAVEIELVGAPGRAATDATGGFLLQGLEPGEVRVRFERIGYVPAERRIELHNGRRARVIVRLRLRAVALAPLLVRGEGAQPAADFVMDRQAIEASGASTLGDVLQAAAGVVITAGPAGEAVSVRGASSDQVLVLVDGAPLNDPLTGAADVSTVPADALDEVRVLRGARSTTYGPGALGGVVLVTTRSPSQGWSIESGVGSLGLRKGRASAAGQVAEELRIRAQAALRRSGGEFRYRAPAALGGGSAVRRNADSRSASAGTLVEADLAAGRLDARVGADTHDRGVPGPAHALSPAARQQLWRWSGSLAWAGPVGERRLGTTATVGWQRARFHDPDPPLGAAYDDTTRAVHVGASAELAGPGAGRLSGWRVRAHGRALGLRSSALTQRVRQLHLSASAGATLALLRQPTLLFSPSLALHGVDDELYVTHEATLRATLGPVQMHVAHRSAVDPPTPADQYFREGLALQPNPDLRAERVPSELEVGVSLSAQALAVPLALGVTGYHGDTHDMIVWAPDYRFVWSPRNRDVKRRGAEAWLELVPVAGLELRGWYAYARTTYDWPGAADTVQLAYRPRHSARLGLTYDRGDWSAGLAALRTGVRYPVPAHVNALPGYWSVDATLGRTFRLAGADLGARLHVDRLLDNTESFIHGYPEPGRQLRLELIAGAPWPDL